MKLDSLVSLKLNRASTLLLVFVTAVAYGADPKSAGPSNPPAASLSETESDIPQSVFIMPTSPKEGRNPFFPLSTAAVPVVKANPVIVEMAAFTLQGITSPPRRSAIINGQTFEPGEEHELKLPSGGKEMIKCLEIKSDSATISVRGQRRELRLRAGV